MSSIRFTTGCREFDRNFGPGQYVTDLSELQMTALVASAMAVFVDGGPTALPTSGQIPITSEQFRYPANFGFTAIDGRLFLFEGIEYAGNGSALVRVTPLPEAPTTGGGGAVTVADGANVAFGATTDAAAAADGTGNYSLIAAAKRGLLNWAAGLALWTAIRDRLPTALLNGRLATDPLGKPGTSRTLAFTGTSATIALSAGATRFSMAALDAAAYYRVYTGADQIATTDDHLIMAGERLDWDCDANTKIAALRLSTTNGSIRISEII